MGMRYHDKVIELSDVLGVEEAEELLTLVQKHPKAELDLRACTHMHAACLQVLMAARPGVMAWPQEIWFACWLRTALN